MEKYKVYTTDYSFELKAPSNKEAIKQARLLTNDEIIIIENEGKEIIYKR